MWFIRHKIKVIQHLAVTETDWSLLVEVCRVCMCVCIYYYSLIQKLTEVLIDIFNTNIKSLRVTKYKLFIFMATTQLKSYSLIVGMDCDCKSASMDKPLCAPPPQKENNTCTISSSLTMETVRMIFMFFDTCVCLTLILINSQRTSSHGSPLSCFPKLPCWTSHSRLKLCSEKNCLADSFYENQMPQRQT